MNKEWQSILEGLVIHGLRRISSVMTRFNIRSFNILVLKYNLDHPLDYFTWFCEETITNYLFIVMLRLVPLPFMNKKDIITNQI